MTSPFGTIPMSQSQQPFRFISYTGPPKPKKTPLRIHSGKVPPGDNKYHNINESLTMKPDWKTEGGDREELAHTAHTVGVVDSTCSANNEVNEIDGSGRGSGDVSSDDHTNEREDVSMPTTQEASPWPLSRGSSQEDAIIINDSDYDCEAKGDDQSDCTDDCFLHEHHESSTYEQIGSAREGLSMMYGSLNQGSTAEGSTVGNMVDNDDRQTYTTIDSDDGGNSPVRAEIGSQEQENLSAGVPESSSKECSMGPQDMISLKPDDSWGHRSVSVLQKGLKSALKAHAVSELLCFTSSDSEAQDIVPPSDLFAITTTQPCKIEGLVDQSEPLAFEIARGVGSSQSESNSDDKRHDWELSDTQLVRKRKGDALVFDLANKRDARTSNKTSKLRCTAAAGATKEQKQLHYLRRSRKARPTRCIPEIQYGNETGAERNHHNGRLTKAENSKEAYGLDSDFSSPNENAEYEVERILAVRLCHRNLQYRVLWVGYEADSNWYNASNFKNSPRKLREFHEDQPTKPGPPARLSHWEQCWEEDREADDFPDNDQPKRTTLERADY